MKTVYINYSSSVPNKQQIYHGAGNYTNLFLLNLMKEKCVDVEFVLLWQKGYKPREGIEAAIYNSGFYVIREIESLSSSFTLKENSTLFLPIIHTLTDFKAAYKIKKANPTVKLIATIHDLRSQFNEYDPLAHYYFSGWKYYFYFIHKPGFWFINNFFYKPAIKKGLSALAKVFTVSNNSLQDIVKYPFSGEIIPYYQSTLPGTCDEPRNPEQKYLLFVSGNRSSKNLLRTLEAFCIFKKTDTKDYFLYVTGLNEQTYHNLLRYKKLDKDIIHSHVRILGYVDDEALDRLYKNCGLLVYASKFEGFGLPVLEVARHGRPSLSSYAKSIPEVLGCSIHYVDPYNPSSIAKGMEYMTKEHILARYEKWIADLYPILEQKMAFNWKVVVQHLLD